MTVPGQEYRYDAEYKCNGVSNLFVSLALLKPWRHVQVTYQRTKVDWAKAIRRLVDKKLLEYRKIVLMMDNLNTHNSSALYETFPAEEAKRNLDKLEIH